LQLLRVSGRLAKPPLRYVIFTVTPWQLELKFTPRITIVSPPAVNSPLVFDDPTIDTDDRDTVSTAEYVTELLVCPETFTETSNDKTPLAAATH